MAFQKASKVNSKSENERLKDPSTGSICLLNIFPSLKHFKVWMKLFEVVIVFYQSLVIYSFYKARLPVYLG